MTVVEKLAGTIRAASDSSETGYYALALSADKAANIIWSSVSQWVAEGSKPMWEMRAPGLIDPYRVQMACSGAGQDHMVVRDRVSLGSFLRCRICGRRAADYVDIELHVHHIRPHGTGGLTEPGNLITLCRTCHVGLDPHYEARLLSMVPGTTSSMAVDLCLRGERLRRRNAPVSPTVCARLPAGMRRSGSSERERWSGV